MSYNTGLVICTSRFKSRSRQKKACVNTYGNGCAKNCSENCKHVAAGSRCDHRTGQCVLGCKPGYHSFLCEKACSDWTYGEQCGSKCSSNCYKGSNGRICDSEFGFCKHGCLPGYIGMKCDHVDPRLFKKSKDPLLGKLGRSVIVYGTNTMVIVIIGLVIFLLIVTP
ncbi:multiple epidermal growth factor-like domains 10 [Elysia marginata]|uniref:Multiple epidermal growth factor-like domains 10 n=1 Tax=Elysia marginata TaxID=1093978 RepID=A0AAV4GHM2_9GAST|nr:multiple epidermal growth factor-like domains 10 [Elysia marginata]